MSRLLHHCRKRLIAGLACGLMVAAFTGQSVRAGNITIVISQAGKASVSVTLGSGFETSGTDANNVAADAGGIGVGTLNAALNSAGYDFNFAGLSAKSSDPNSSVASLFLTGQVYRTTSTGGPLSITIDATQNGYQALAGASGVLTSFSTANFFGASGGISQVGTSYFSTTNTQDDTTGPFTTAPTIVPPGGTEFEPPINVPSIPQFALTNRVVITLGADGTGGSNPPTDQFTHSTTVEALAVPEPGSVAMLGMGMPVAFMGLFWIRRRRAIA